MAPSLFHPKQFIKYSGTATVLFLTGLILAIGIGITVWSLFPKIYGVLPLDDAYIHLVYISNLASSGTLSFNIGELSTGTSSPLWTAINAGLVSIGIDAYWAVLYTSLVMFGAILVLTAVITRNIARGIELNETVSSCIAIFATLLLAVNGNLIWLSLSGMETMMFIALGLLSIVSFHRYKFNAITGILCGLLLLTHPSGIALLGPLAVIGLLKGGRSGVIRGLIATMLVVLPYLLFSFLVNGDILPTTGRGKVLTYVDSGFDLSDMFNFIKGFINYQVYLPQHYILIASLALCLSLLLWRNIQGCSIQNTWGNITKQLSTLYREHVNGTKITSNVHGFIQNTPLLQKHLLVTLLITWGASHLFMYAISFRILLHHTRYLSNEYVILTILAAIGVGYIHKHITKLPIGILLMAIALSSAVITCVSWSSLYHNNIRQIEGEYIKMADWTAQNTQSEARIAAFDVGILKYFSNRHIIDLGGIISREAHDCLLVQSCGGFLYDSEADYIMYSRNPDVDVYNGIYKAEYEGPMLLTQKPLVYFDYPQYTAPTLTHSHRLDMYQILGWSPKSNYGALNAFKYDGTAFEPAGEIISDEFELVGYLIDHRQIEKIPYHPLFLNVTFYFRAITQLQQPYWVHMQILSEDLEHIYFYSRHIPTHNLVKPTTWPIGDIIKDHHIRAIPEELSPGVYTIRIVISHEKELDGEKLESYPWIDIGHLINHENRLKPVTIVATNKGE
jgi:hypothetical protein